MAEDEQIRLLRLMLTDLGEIRVAGRAMNETLDRMEERAESISQSLGALLAATREARADLVHIKRRLGVSS